MSAWSPSPSGSDPSPTLRTISIPGRSDGTMNIAMPRYGDTSGLVTAITMTNAAVLAFEEKNFHPFSTHSSPSRTARVLNWVGSAPASGSAMAEVGRPQTLLGDRLLERVDDLPDRLARGRERQVGPDQVERLDVLAHERVRPVQFRLELGLGLEIPRHRGV